MCSFVQVPLAQTDTLLLENEKKQSNNLDSFRGNVFKEKILDEVGKPVHKDSIGRLAHKENKKPSNDTIIPDSNIKKQVKLDTPRDSIVRPKSGNKQIKFSDDGLDTPISYGSIDSQLIDIKHNIVHLYGEAYVDYGEMKLKAGYIQLDTENNIAIAEFIRNEKGDTIQKPIFNDGEREFNYNKLKYNFKEERGIVYDAITTEGELFIHGEITKYVSFAGDSVHNEKVVYNKNALITTCDHPEPHFGIRSSKMKMITDKVAVIGPSNLELGGVPTPIWIPFGFFPLTDGESTGLLFDQDFHYSQQNGFGLENIGWYFPLNEYANLIVRGDIYTSGTHGVNIESNYKKRYRNNGRFNLGYYNQRIETIDDDFKTGKRESIFKSTKSFSISLKHNQEAKAHPYRNISGSIEVQSQNYAAMRRNDANSTFQNIYRSNFSYSHSMPRTPFTFSLAFRHEQNTQTRKVSITLPDIQIRMNTIYPFKRKNSSGNKEKWFEKISYRYNSEIKNYTETTDSTFFDKQFFDEMRTGVSHSMRSDASFRFLKYFNFTPSISYDEDWVWKTLEKDYVGVESLVNVDSTIFRNNMTIDTIVERDTILFEVQDTFVNGFKPYRDFSVSAGFNTQLFATIPSAKGWFRGWRQTIKPSASISFDPNTKDLYELTLETGLDEDDLIEYSPFQRSAISVPGLSETQFNANYGVTGVMEMKYYSKKEEKEKKIKIFDQMRISSRYNFAADSLNYAPVNTSGTSRWFKGATTFSFNFRFDPYVENENGKTSTLVSSTGKSLVRLDDGFLKLSTRLKAKDFINFFAKNKDNQEEKTDDKNDSNELWSIEKWLENFSIEHEIQYNFQSTKGIDTSFVNVHSLRMSGNIPLTKNWNLVIQNFSYDFKTNKFVYPAFRFSRKLHCWDMNFEWYPAINSYNFSIKVNSGTLGFLKYDYGQSQIDGLANRF